MTEIKLHLDPAAVLFYSRIAAAVQLPLEQVLSDALFKLAGELSLEALESPRQQKDSSANT
jgi:hypothetical protein